MQLLSISTLSGVTWSFLHPISRSTVPNHQSFQPNPHRESYHRKRNVMFFVWRCFSGKVCVCVCVCVSVCPNQGFLVHKAWNSHEKLWTDGYVHGNLRAPPNAIPPQNWYVPNDGSFCQKVLERNFPIRSWWSALVSQAIKTPNDRGLQLMFRDMSELYSINPQTEFNWFVKRRNLKPPRIHVFHLDKNPCKRW